MTSLIRAAAGYNAGQLRSAGEPRRLSGTPTLLASPGQVAAFGDAPAVHAQAGTSLVGIAICPTGGYWALDAHGRLYADAGAPFFGSLADHRGIGPIAGVVADPAGEGYWIFTARGAIYTFGKAKYFGSPSYAKLGSMVTGMAALPDGQGYWVATSKGKVFAFGESKAVHAGRVRHFSHPVVGMATSPEGRGYWLVTSDGSVYPYGHAHSHGSLAGSHEIVAAVASALPGDGYWLVSRGGKVHAFGHAAELGSARTAPGVAANAIAPAPLGAGYVLAAGQSPLVPVDLKDLKNLGRAARSAANSTSTVAQKMAPTTADSSKPRTSATRSAISRATTTTTSGRQLLGQFTVTCYDLYGHTRSGALAGPDSVAVDPNVIPLGTRIYIDGVGPRTADDTGGAIIGDHVDIWEPTYSQCANWGVQVRGVYRLEG